MKISASEIDTVARFSSKAANYARYRWGYQAAAYDFIVQTVGLTQDSVVADIGAGPGTIAGNLLERAGRVYAVEPNSDMRMAAAQQFGEHPALALLPASAEATTLPDRAVDLITVGRAIHWFDPAPARREFQRILRPGGWLAILQDDRSQNAVEQAARALHSEELGWDVSYSKLNLDVPPLSYYFGGEHYQTQRFPFHITETYEQFLGRQSSLSSAPDPDHPLRPAYEQRTRAIFDQYSQGGLLQIDVATLVHLGRMQ